MMAVFKCTHKTKTRFHVLSANLAKNLPVSPRAHQEFSWFCPCSLFLSSSKYSRNNVCAKTQWLFPANLSGHPALCFSFSLLFSFMVCCYAPQMRSNPAAMTTELFRALKSKQPGCWHALCRKTQSCFRPSSKILHHLSLFPWFWWLWEFVVLQSFNGSLLFLFCAEDTGAAKQLQGMQQFHLPSCTTSSSIVKATERLGSSEGLREQPVAVWMHRQRGELLSIALQISLPN